MTNDKLSVGDVVQLKSGGPYMTIQGFVDVGFSEAMQVGKTKELIAQLGLDSFISEINEIDPSGLFIAICQWFDDKGRLQVARLRSHSLRKIEEIA